MADANYENQAKIYLKQGAAEQVIADGGTVTVESGGEITIETGGLITAETGGKITTESGGEIETQSGTSVDFQSGTNFYFDGSTAFASDKMMYTLFSLNTRTTPWGESGTTISGGSVITPGYGYHIFSLTTGLSGGTRQLPTAYVGARLNIDGSGLVTDGHAIIYGSNTAGVSVAVIDKASTLCSSITLSAAGKFELVCFTTGVWAVVEHNASATPQPIA